MQTGSFRLGSLFGIPILAHWSAALIGVFVGLNLFSMAGPVGGVIAIVGFAASILLHELAHALTARRYGVRTLSIELWALGGVARLDRESPTARADGLIAGAGPAMSFTLAGTLIGTFFLLRPTPLPSEIVGVIGWLALVNGILAVFNLLPGAPLDGGRILRAIRWARHGDRFRAAAEAAKAGQVVGWSMAGVGVWLLLNGHPGLMVILTGAFLAVNAKAEGISSQVSASLVGTRVGELTCFGIAHAAGSTDAETMLWQRQRLGLPGVVAVQQADGRLEGLVAEDQLWNVPEEQRATMRLTQLMIPFSRLAKADPDEDVADVLSRLNPIAPIVTVWRDGRLLGVVPAATIRNRLTAAARAMRP
ncbi:MAG: site-2 protease family protein [Acidimicrobiia bacterium]